MPDNQNKPFSVLDYAPIGSFVLDSDYTVLHWNRCLEQWSNISAEEILGKNILNIFPHLNHPMYLIRLADIFAGGAPAFFSAQLHTYIIPAYLKSGVLRTQQTTVSAVRLEGQDGYAALFAIQDVTDLTQRLNDYFAMKTTALKELDERKRVEGELVRQKELLHGVLESLAARIAVLDRQGTIIALNESGESFTALRCGITPLSVGADYPSIFLSGQGEDRQRGLEVYDGIMAVLGGRLPRFEIEYQCGDCQNEEWYIISVTPLGQGEQGAVVSHVDITSRKRAEQQIAHMAMHDPLTGLPNRKLFADRLEVALGRAKRASTGLAVIYLDLDDFKPVNDNLGHETGDIILREVGLRLASCLRGCDTVARMGGDEFAVLLTDIKAREQASVVTRKLIEAMNQTFHPCEECVRLSASAGVSVYPDTARNLRELIRNADVAMYQAKREGKNSFKFYEPDMG